MTPREIVGYMFLAVAVFWLGYFIILNRKK